MLEVNHFDYTPLSLSACDCYGETGELPIRWKRLRAMGEPELRSEFRVSQTVTRDHISRDLSALWAFSWLGKYLTIFWQRMPDQVNEKKHGVVRYGAQK